MDSAFRQYTVCTILNFCSIFWSIFVSLLTSRLLSTLLSGALIISNWSKLPALFTAGGGGGGGGIGADWSIGAPLAGMYCGEEGTVMETPLLWNDEAGIGGWHEWRGPKMVKLVAEFLQKLGHGWSCGFTVLWVFYGAVRKIENYLPGCCSKNMRNSKRPIIVSSRESKSVRQWNNE